MVPPLFGVTEGLMAGEGLVTYRLSAFANWMILAAFVYTAALAFGWAASGFVND